MVASQVTGDDETAVAGEDADAGGEGRGSKTMTPSDWGRFHQQSRSEKA